MDAAAIAALAPEQRRELYELLKIKAARTSLAGFIEARGAGIKPARHHRLLIEHLEAVERGEIERLMVCMPPGSAKSTYTSVEFPPWFIGRNPTKSIIAASHTQELAERFGRRVRNIVASAEYRALFGFGVASDSASAGRWETERGGEYFAAGVGGSITGRRADVGLVDDPIKSREDADSERTRERTWDWYINDFLTRLKPGGRQIVVMTRWHEDDLGGRILERERERWTVLEIAMEAHESDPLGRQPGERLWPEWFTDEMVATAKLDQRSWEALYQQRPRASGGGEFKREWLQWYDQVNRRDLSVVMLVDPSAGRNDKSDYTSIWIVGLGPDDNYYVLDALRDRLNLTQRAEAVFRLHRKWKPAQVRYERYGMMADVEYLKAEMNRRTYRFPIEEVGGASPKNDRIRRLVPLFQRGRVWMPPNLYYTGAEGKVRDLIEEFVEQEYLAFPVGRHDDMIDALARIEEPGLDLPWPKAEQMVMPTVPSFGVFDSVAGY